MSESNRFYKELVEIVNKPPLYSNERIFYTEKQVDLACALKNAIEELSRLDASIEHHQKSQEGHPGRFPWEERYGQMIRDSATRACIELLTTVEKVGRI